MVMVLRSGTRLAYTDGSNVEALSSRKPTRVSARITERKEKEQKEKRDISDAKATKAFAKLSTRPPNNSGADLAEKQVVPQKEPKGAEPLREEAIALKTPVAKLDWNPRLSAFKPYVKPQQNEMTPVYTQAQLTTMTQTLHLALKRVLAEYFGELKKAGNPAKVNIFLDWSKFLGAFREKGIITSGAFLQDLAERKLPMLYQSYQVLRFWSNSKSTKTNCPEDKELVACILFDYLPKVDCSSLLEMLINGLSVEDISGKIGKSIAETRALINNIFPGFSPSLPGDHSPMVKEILGQKKHSTTYLLKNVKGLSMTLLRYLVATNKQVQEAWNASKFDRSYATLLQKV